MSHLISYSALELPNPGKKGILKKLDNDYFEIILGAWGTTGNGGWIYDEQAAINYMNQDSQWLQAIRDQQLRSEWGHPVRQPGMTDQEWFQRIHTILESNWSSHIRKIHLSTNTVTDKKGRKVIAVIGEVTPSGKHADAFRRQLENPDEDVSYSVRSFARKCFRTHRKFINKIINFDSVGTPGIGVASKRYTPSMEAMQYGDATAALDEWELNLESLESEMNESMESGDELSMEAAEKGLSFLHDLVTPKQELYIPAQYRY